MVTRKYIRDYRFSETVDEKGRIRTEAVYVGKTFRFSEEESAKRSARAMLPMICLGWLAFIAALLPHSTASHTMYAILPFAFIALPLGRLTQTLWLLRGGKTRFIRSEAEKIHPRARSSSASVWILAALALAGEGIAAILSAKLLFGDLIFALSCAVLLFAGLRCFALARTLALREE